MSLNFRLALLLALKSLRHHRLVSGATVLGVAIGMCVVSTILIVDHNTARTDNLQQALTSGINTGIDAGGQPGAGAYRHPLVPPVTRIEIVNRDNTVPPGTGSPLPNQRVSTAVSADRPPTPRGEEDYQAMRMANRMVW